MKFLPSRAPQGRVGIAGHAGIGHAYSHSGYFQEDSGGFAILLTLLQQVCGCDCTIASVRMVDAQSVCVETAAGGIGQATARHPFTCFEERLMRATEGMCCLAPQTLACQCFGRVYGQGAGTQASTFSLAVAKALLDTVRKNWPAPLHKAPEELPGCCGEYLGGVMELAGDPIAWLLTINAACGGVGPVEDCEGCVPIGNKGRIMQALGMTDSPLIVLEGKTFVPQLEDRIDKKMLFVRWNEDWDNPVVGQCLTSACEISGHPYITLNTAYPRDDGLEREGRRLGEQVAALGRAYAAAHTSVEKVRIAAELADICACDAGGSIFMTNSIYRLVGGGGLWPGMGAMLSLVVGREDMQREGYAMWFSPEELALGARVVAEACRLLLQRHEVAMHWVHERKPPHTPEALLTMAQPQRP